MSSPQTIPTALFIGSPDESVGDKLIEDKLVELGFTVTTKSLKGKQSAAKNPAGPVTEADALGKSLVIISSTIEAEVLRDEFAETPVPVIVLDAPLCQEMGLTFATDEAELEYGQIDITTPGHPLAAGLIGLIRVGAPKSVVIYGRPGERALKIASIPGAVNATVIFAYEGSEEMIEEFIAPARRVGLAFNDHLIKEAVAAHEQDEEKKRRDATRWREEERDTRLENILRLFESAVLWATGRIDKHEPKTFSEIFMEECGEIRDRRYRQRLMIRKRHEETNGDGLVAGDANKEELEKGSCPPENLVGLALSGGGIRSATFSLGLLQGLKATGVLYLFDYLSTVSGGGYVGGWWSAWLAREIQDEREDPAFPPTEKIMPARSNRNLSAWSSHAKNLMTESVAPEEQGTEGSDFAGSDPVHHLRLFSNYLTPRKGTLSGDTWRAVAIVTRNMALTWLILVPILFAAVIAGQLYFIVQTDSSRDNFAHTEPSPTPAAVVSTEKDVNLKAVVTNDSEISWKGTITPKPAPQGEAASAIHHYSSADILERRALRASLPLIALTVWIVIMICAWMLSNTSGNWKLGLVGGTATWVLIGLALGLKSPATVKALLWPSSQTWNDPDNLLKRVSLEYGLAALALLIVGGILWFRAWWLSRREDRGDGNLRARLKSMTMRREKSKKTGKRVRPDVYRNRIIRTHASLLVSLVLIAFVLSFAGFGHEIAEYLFEAGESYVKKMGGALAVLLSMVGSVWMIIKSRPTGGGDAKSGKLSLADRIVFAITPPLVMLVLMIALAWTAHMLLSYIAHAGLAHLMPLDMAIFVSLFLSSVFTVAEISWPQPAARWRRARAWAFALLGLSILLAGLLNWPKAQEFGFSSLLGFRPALTLASLTLFVILFRLLALYRKRDERNAWGLISNPARDFQVRRWITAGILVLLFILSVVVVWWMGYAAPALAGLPKNHLLLASAAFGGIFFCLFVTVFEIFFARGQNHLSLWLLFSNGLLLTTMLCLSFFNNTAPTSAVNLAHAAVGLLTLALGWVIALGWLADPNALSLHMFYKARLVRAYMGASNRNRFRQKAEITEAVEGDDVSLKDLNNCRRGAPYHLINTTLNLVGGRDLSTTQRASAMFVLSKRFCGSTRTLYRRTTEYMDGQLTLGTGVAVSGAAASPNMGALRTTAAQAMLLTLLNVRLGYWAPTPNREHWRDSRARLWPFYMLREFLSQTNDLGNYCYLTDGGHFDNLALYSLVERGCRFIVASDASADPKPCFSDLGDVIRRCRIDFGAEIDLNVESMKRDEKTKEAATFVVGTITYAKEHLEALGWKSDANEMNRRGVIIFIKPALMASLNADVRQYSLENDAFPDQTTADQFFDEAQFESYRKLGETCAQQAFQKIVEEAGDDRFDELLKKIRYDQYLSTEEEKELARLLQFRKIVNLMRAAADERAASTTHVPSRWDDKSPLDYRDIETIFKFLKELAEEQAK